MQTIVFDIDGTIADCAHRLHHLEGEKKDYASFYAKVKDDAPIKEMRKLYTSLSFYSNIVLCTGRSEICMDDTISWLKQHKFRFVALYMRKKNDRRPDYKVKLDLLEQMREDGFNPDLVFEDRTQVVKMWRDAGIRCLQVCNGDY